MCLGKPPRQYSVATFLPKGQDLDPLANLSNMINSYLARNQDGSHDLEKNASIQFYFLRPELVEATIEPADKDVKPKEAETETNGSTTVGNATFSAGALVDASGVAVVGEESVKDQQKKWVLTPMMKYPLVKVISQVPDEV
jgi:hypothetical protein